MKCQQVFSVFSLRNLEFLCLQDMTGLMFHLRQSVKSIGNPNINVFSNHQVVLLSFFKFCQVLLWPPSGMHANYPRQTCDEQIRGDKNHMARLNKLTTAPSYDISFNFSFPFPIALKLKPQPLLVMF